MYSDKTTKSEENTIQSINDFSTSFQLILSHEKEKVKKDGTRRKNRPSRSRASFLSDSKFSTGQLSDLTGKSHAPGILIGVTLKLRPYSYLVAALTCNWCQFA